MLENLTPYFVSTEPMWQWLWAVCIDAFLMVCILAAIALASLKSEDDLLDRHLTQVLYGVIAVLGLIGAFYSVLWEKEFPLSPIAVVFLHFTLLLFGAPVGVILASVLVTAVLMVLVNFLAAKTGPSTMSII